MANHFYLNEIPQDMDLPQCEIEVPTNDIQVIVTNDNDNDHVIDLNPGVSEMVYPLLEVDLNAMYEEEYVEGQFESEVDLNAMYEEEDVEGQFESEENADDNEDKENLEMHLTQVRNKLDIQ